MLYCINFLGVLLYFLIPVVFCGGRYAIIDPEPSSYATHAEMALYMVERYISPYTNTLVIKQRCVYCRTPWHKNFPLGVLEHFLRNIDDSMALQLFFGRPHDRPWDYNVFIVDSEEAFTTLRFNIPNTPHERQFHFFIILTGEWSDHRSLHSTLIHIFRLCMEINVYTGVAMVQEKDESFGFYSTDRYGPRHCNGVGAIYRFNNFRNGRLEHDYLFTPPLINFHGCILNVCAHLVPPLLSFDGNSSDQKDLQSLERFSGIDGDILREIANILNFRVNISIKQSRNMPGESNSSAVCFDELVSEQADFAIGGFSVVVSDAFSASLSYHQSPYVFVVHRGLHFGPIKQLANPFRYEVWCAIGGMCLLFIIIVRYVSKCTTAHLNQFSTYNFSTINMITVLMGNALKSLPFHSHGRLLLMSWMLGTLVLRNAYQGQLFDSLRAARRVPVPRSISEMIDQRYILLAAKYKDFYPNNLTILVENSEVRDQLVQKANRERLSMYMLLDALNSYNYVNRNSTRLTYVDEPIYLFQLALNFRKYSILRDSFDLRLNQLMTAGITSHVEKKFQRSESLYALEVRVQRVNNNLLRGLYGFYSTLLGYAFFVFLWELLSRKWRFARRIMDSLH